MKDQASLNLLIVDSPIDSKALTGHLMLRATSSGLKVYDVNGSEQELGGAGTVDLSNYSTSTIQLTSTDGTIKLINGNNNGSIQLVATNDEYPDRATFQTPGVWDIKLDSYLTKISGTQQMDIEANGSACPVKITAGSNGGDIELEASGTLKYNGADLNTANGLVQLGSDGMIPTSLYNAGGGSVDLSSYVGGIGLISSDDVPVVIAFSSGNPTYNANLTMNSAGVTLAGYGDVSVEHTGGAYLRLSSGEVDLSSEGSLLLQATSRLTINATEGIYLGGAGLNTAGGLVKLGDDGKIPSNLYDAGGSVDLSSYTGFVNINGIDGDSTISADNNLYLKSNSNVVLSGVIVASQTDFFTPSVSSENGDLLIRTSNNEHSIVLAPGSVSEGNPADAPSGSIKFYADNIVYNDHPQNTADGLAVIGSDGKLPSTIIPESTGGSFDPTDYQGTLNLTNTTDVVNVTSLVSNGTNIYLSYSNVENNTIVDLSSNKLDLGVTTAGSGEKITFDLTDGVNIISEIGLKYNGAVLNTAGGLVQVGEDGKIPSSLYEAGSGGDTSALEERVTTLEGTVGTLDAAVDEILADYGEGSGALVYRVVASATEPENPTEGMIWIQTT